jgi:hypothetical protein
MPCPSCGAKLNRRLDIQVFLPVFTTVIFCFLVVYSVVTVGLPASIGKALLVVAAIAAALADVLTVRLVVVRKRRGVIGYAA